MIIKLKTIKEVAPLLNCAKITVRRLIAARRIPILKYEENECQKMREKIDKAKYRNMYSRRMQIVEPVFADITYCKGIMDFTPSSLHG